MLRSPAWSPDGARIAFAGPGQHRWRHRTVRHTIDSLIRTYHQPIKLARDRGNAQLDESPVLQVGDSITLRGYTITVAADNGHTHTVTTTQDN